MGGGGAPGAGRCGLRAITMSPRRSPAIPGVWCGERSRTPVADVVVELVDRDHGRRSSTSASPLRRPSTRQLGEQRAGRGRRQLVDRRSRDPPPRTRTRAPSTADSVTRPRPSKRCSTSTVGPLLAIRPRPNAPLWQQSSMRTIVRARLSCMTPLTKPSRIASSRYFQEHGLRITKFKQQLLGGRRHRRVQEQDLVDASPSPSIADLIGQAVDGSADLEEPADRLLAARRPARPRRPTVPAAREPGVGVGPEATSSTRHSGC